MSDVIKFWITVGVAMIIGTSIGIVTSVDRQSNSRLDNFDKDWIIQELQEERAALTDSLRVRNAQLQNCTYLPTRRRLP